MVTAIISLFLSGILFGSGPCIASCGPILISYVAGTGRTLRQGLSSYFIFSFSRIFVYLVLGITVSSLGRFIIEKSIGAFSKYVFIFGGGFIILVGILTALGKNAGEKHCLFLRNNFVEQDKKSLIVLGLIIGLLPCLPLLAIFSYIGLVSHSWLESLFYSLSFGMGTILSPLIGLVMLSSLVARCVKGRGNRIFNIICGLVIIFLGIWMFTRGF